MQRHERKEVCRGSNRCRPLPLHTPDRVRAKRSGEMPLLLYREEKGVGITASTASDRPALRIDGGCPLQPTTCTLGGGGQQHLLYVTFLKRLCSWINRLVRKKRGEMESPAMRNAHWQHADICSRAIRTQHVLPHSPRRPDVAAVTHTQLVLSQAESLSVFFLYSPSVALRKYMWNPSG